jgi:D-alanyl-D-alanine carboxypeptidase
MLPFILTAILFFYPSSTISQAIFLDQTVENGLNREVKTSYSLGPKLTAKSAIVFNLKNNEVLFSKNSDEKLPIASITKLMTTIVFLENKNVGWDDWIEIKPIDLIAHSKQSGDLEPAGLGLAAGQKIKVKDIFNAGLIRSANDAMMTISRLVNLPEGKNFTDLMNEKAQQIGLNNTNFSEPTGLSQENISTVDDLVKLVIEASKRDEIKQALANESYTFLVKNFYNQTRRWMVNSTNKLLSNFIKLNLAKTGYLPVSGYCLAGLSDYQDKQLVVVVLGADSEENRFQEVKSLIWWANEQLNNQTVK